MPYNKEGDYLPFSEWLNSFKGSGFEDYNSVGRKILHALHSLRINSLKELANTPPSKIRNRHSVGDKSFEIIQSVLERNGLSWDINKGA